MLKFKEINPMSDLTRVWSDLLMKTDSGLCKTMYGV